jgi:heptosyltransferase-2
MLLSTPPPVAVYHPAVLIVGPAWVGDMVMAQSLFKTLKRRQPGRQIDVLAPPWTLPLLERMPEVRQAIPLALGHGELNLAERRRVALELRQHRYEQAIVLPNSFKSALIPWLAGIPLRTGYSGELRYGLLNDRRYLNKLTLLRAVDRFVALGHEASASAPVAPPHPRLEIAHHKVAEALARLNLQRPQQPLLALCPGAEYGPAKRWPEIYFAEVAKHALAQGWLVWLFGSEKDMPVGGAIQKLAPGSLNLCGLTHLGEAVDLLALADQVVSNDSGLMHVAAALDKPLVALFGSSDPGFTPPLSNRAQILYLRLACSPCFGRDCRLKHLKCLRDLSPDQVIAALAKAGG